MAYLTKNFLRQSISIFFVILQITGKNMDMKIISADDKERLRTEFLRAGACSVGFATAREAGPECISRHDSWISAGHNAGMAYLAAHRDVRNNPGLLLEGARTVISLAFPYTQPRLRPESAGHISEYAYGRDYHCLLYT